MQFDTSLLMPTLRRSRELVFAMPGTVLVGWLGAGAAGLLADIGFAMLQGRGTGVWVAYGAALAVVNVWMTRETLLSAGIRPALTFANIVSV